MMGAHCTSTGISVKGICTKCKSLISTHLSPSPCNASWLIFSAFLLEPSQASVTSLQALLVTHELVPVTSLHLHHYAPSNFSRVYHLSPCTALPLPHTASSSCSIKKKRARLRSRLIPSIPVSTVLAKDVQSISNPAVWFMADKTLLIDDIMLRHGS
jgi:hypothetical protein